MLGDGAGTERCHYVQSIPSFVFFFFLKKATGRKRGKKERLLSTHMKSILNYLSCTTEHKQIDQTVTFFFWNPVFITHFQMKIADLSNGDSMVHKQVIKQ